MPPGRVVDEFAKLLDDRALPQQGMDGQPVKSALAQHETRPPIERAGPGLGREHGAITGRFTALIERAVHNEPFDHALRGTLDHHIVQKRNIAERRHIPSINKSKLVSRPAPGSNTPIEQSLALRTAAPLADCEDTAELARLGARNAGTNGELDIATELYPHPEVLLSQTKDEGAAFTECYAVLEKIKGSTPGKGDGS
jgi:flagellar biosynthesis/type III secretory pathway ATPase